MSSSQYAVQVRGLSKCYRLAAARAQHTTIREALIARLRGARRPSTNPFWALRDVSFDLEQGEVLGIIGRNGAGKSTLLKVLSRITGPTEGEVHLRGRVGSLLEVGTGFHPELTGRENVYLNGAILGIPRAEIARQFDEIVDFAGVERFLDTPVKRFSSGMYVRLAFAVAAHLNSDILIVDEVLAVGDAEFQEKCLGRMRSVSRSGRTVLFVSHNIAAIRSLCTSGLLLHEGAVICRGDVAECVQAYLKDSRFHLTSCWERGTTNAAASLRVESVAAELVGEQPEHQLMLNISLSSVRPHHPAFVAVDILDAAGSPVMQACPTVEGFIRDTRRSHNLDLAIDLPPLIPGRYLLSVWVGSHNSDTYDMVKECVGFEVRASPTPRRTFPHTLDHGYVVPKAALSYRSDEEDMGSIRSAG